MASNQNPKLEVPSNDAQTLRQEIIVQKLLNNDKTKPLDKSVPAPSSIINSSLINQVKAFMPQIKTANDELDKMENKSAVQIDLDDHQNGTIEQDDKPYVEMNLQLYEENSGTSDSDSDSTNSTSSPSSSSSEDEEDDDDTVPSKQQKLNLITEIDE